MGDAKHLRDTVPNVPCGVESRVRGVGDAGSIPRFLMYRVELKATKYLITPYSNMQMFLMYRVELKAGSDPLGSGPLGSS